MERILGSAQLVATMRQLGTPSDMSCHSSVSRLPPTTLDGSRPANADKMKHFMISVGLSSEQGEQVAEKLKSSLSITSMVQFGWWFSEHPLKDWFHSLVEWRNNAPLFVGMQCALTACSNIMFAKEKNEEQLKVDDKIPMVPLLNRASTRHG